MPRELDGDEKLMDLAAQLRAMELSLTEVLICPYCQGRNLLSLFFNQDAEGICCDKFAFALAAIVDRKRQDDIIETAERALEGMDGKALLN